MIRIEMQAIWRSNPYISRLLLSIFVQSMREHLIHLNITSSLRVHVPRFDDVDNDGDGDGDDDNDENEDDDYSRMLEQ